MNLKKNIFLNFLILSEEIRNRFLKFIHKEITFIFEFVQKIEMKHFYVLNYLKD